MNTNAVRITNEIKYMQTCKASNQTHTFAT